MIILDQRVDSFEMITVKKKLKAIVRIVFSKKLKDLKHYLNLTE